ncbi:MAG TPA: hypothetical protein VF103_00005 [Polyangiaceae bacterium]
MSAALRVVASAVLLVGIGGYVVAYRAFSQHTTRTAHSVPETTQTTEANEPSEVSDLVTAVTVTAPTRPPATEPSPLDEPALMTKLRAFGPAEQEQAIRLARQGNLRFPTSPDAAERAWYVVKSLAGLGRFHEARDEARAMVGRFRGTPWAEDVERHALVYPLDQPSREEQQEWESQ